MNPLPLVFTGKNLDRPALPEAFKP